MVTSSALASSPGTNGLAVQPPSLRGQVPLTRSVLTPKLPRGSLASVPVGLQELVNVVVARRTQGHGLAIVGSAQRRREDVVQR